MVVHYPLLQRMSDHDIGVVVLWCFGFLEPSSIQNAAILLNST